MKHIKLFENFNTPFPEEVDLIDYLQEFFDKYSIKNFIKFVNQHIKKLCLANDITTEVSTYWARHTFATLAVRNGASLEFIQESLGHGDLKTTQGYFAGFDNEAKKEFAGKIMDF